MSMHGTAVDQTQDFVAKRCNWFENQTSRRKDLRHSFDLFSPGDRCRTAISVSLIYDPLIINLKNLGK